MNRFGQRFLHFAALACMRRSPLVLRRSGSTRLFASTPDAWHASGSALGAKILGKMSPWLVRYCQSGQLALVACHGEEPNLAFKRTAHGKPWSTA